MDAQYSVCFRWSVKFAALLCAFVLMFGNASSGHSQEGTDYEVVAENLQNPRGIAIQPETGHVFVAESGALRVVRIVDGESEEAVVGFSKDYTGKNPIYEIGPLSLLFLDRDTLLIGDGGQEAGTEQIHVVKVPEPGERPVRVRRDPEKRLRLQADDQHGAEGNFWAMAQLDNYVLAVCGEDVRNGWVARSAVRGGNLTQLRRFFSTVRSVNTRTPHGMTTSPEGEIVIAQAGETQDVDDSLLVFFGPDGDFLDSFKTSLNDIYGIAYGPNRGRLFAVDFCNARPNEGGLYKLVATREGCRAVRMKTLSRPTSLAFSEAGDLYVTTVGRYVEGAQVSNGRLLRFTGLDKPEN